MATWVLIKIYKFDLENTGARYEPEVLLLLPPPNENWAQSWKRLVYIGKNVRGLIKTHKFLVGLQSSCILKRDLASSVVVLKGRESIEIVSCTLIYTRPYKPWIRVLISPVVS